MITIDTKNMCSYLQHKLFEEDDIYHSLWIAMQADPELTAVVRSQRLQSPLESLTNRENFAAAQAAVEE